MRRAPGQDGSGLWVLWLERAVYFLLCLFVILLPHSIKGAQHVWQIAFVLWLITLALKRQRPFPQPLCAPLLAYLVLSAVSTMLSPDPYLSWGAMKRVCLVAVGILVAQSVTRLSQVRVLVLLLLLSGLAAAAFTGWQYLYGIGVQVTGVSPETALSRAGIRDGDIITAIGGHRANTPAQLRSAGEGCAPGSIVRINFLRGFPLHRRTTYAACDPLRASLSDTRLQLQRARPIRAQGTLGHYIVFAETLLPVACLAWAMLLGTPSRRRAWQALFALIFISLALTIFATQTRAAIAGLAAGCFVALQLLAARRTRLWAYALLALLLAAATLWIQHTRGMNWIGAHDPGTQYRLLMWQDGLRLVRQHPWFGVGMDTIFKHWQEWNIRAWALYHQQWHFHSDFVQLAVERGLLTLAAWLWFLAANFVFLYRLLRRAEPRSRLAAAVIAGALSGWAAFLVPSLVEYCLYNETLVMLLFFLFGIAIAIERMLSVPGAIDVED